MHRWRYPSLSLHGIEGAFSGSGAKTVIPRKVVGKFSIRLVPNMTPEVVSEQVLGAQGLGEGAATHQQRFRGQKVFLQTTEKHKPKTICPHLLAIANSVSTRTNSSEIDRR